MLYIYIYILMTGNIPEEIIRKIMYTYNSHPIVDLLKVDEQN